MLELERQIVFNLQVQAHLAHVLDQNDKKLLCYTEIDIINYIYYRQNSMMYTSMRFFSSCSKLLSFSHWMGPFTAYQLQLLRVYWFLLTRSSIG